MAETHALPANVRLLDGGTQGLYLLPFLEEADALIVFDAIDYGLAPGTMKIVRDGEVPAFMGAKKMSLHPDRLSGRDRDGGVDGLQPRAHGADRLPAGGA